MIATARVIVLATFILSQRLNQTMQCEGSCHYFINFLSYPSYGTKIIKDGLVTLKDVRGWQFLTMKAAETLCIVCLPPEKHIS